MFGRSFPLALSAGLLGLLAPQNASADPDAPTPVPGVDIQARGPIHEAFAAPVDGQPRPAPVVSQEPPAAIDEAPPDQKPQGDDVQWIPGYWQWDDGPAQFVWVSGFWRTPPPGRQWVPGRWDKVDDGWQWVGGYWAAAEQDQVTYLPPPPADIDEGPSTPPPDADSLYVPGCWVYRETRFRWRPGYWVASRPEFVWIPAHYEWTPAGCVFVDGYWDYPLADRGLLFAPVCFDQAVLRQPDFVYTPQFVVSADFLPTALFVRPDCRHYYFGDYFDDADERAGYVAWVDVRVGRHGRDPLFDYYRRSHADDRGWERNVRDLYEARYSGDAVRPPRTLGQQDTLLRDIRVGKTVRVDNVRQVNVLAPLGRAATPRPLERIPTSEWQAQRRNGDRLRELAGQQRQTQHEILKGQSGPLQPGAPPHPVKMQLPPAPPRVKTPPPAPVLPREAAPSAPPIHKEITPPAPPVHHQEVTPPPAPIHKEITPPAAPPVHHQEIAPPPAPIHPKEVAPPVHHQEVTPPAPAHKEIAPPPPPVHRVIAPPPTPPAPVHHQEIAPPPPPVHHKDVAPPPAPKPPPPAPKPPAPAPHKK